jgi:hypothetical protein
LSSIVGRTVFYVKLSVRAAKEGHLSVVRQLIEMTLLYVVKGIGPGYYHSAKLWRRNLPFGEKLGWLNQNQYRKRVCQYNRREYQKISQNKLSEKAIYKQFNVPSPDFLGCFQEDWGRDIDGLPLRTGGDVQRLLVDKEINKFCLKVVEGWGGSGFRALQVLRGDGELRLCPLSGQRTFSVGEYFSSLGNTSVGIVLESYSEQHSTMKSFNPSSLNTIRVIVVWQIDSSPSVVGAYVRIGRIGSLVDNVATGGIVALIDMESGVITSAHIGSIDMQAISCHPDHSEVIEGVVIPFWEEVKQMAVDTLPLFPWTRFGGFDIAITDDGPVIIELNVEPDKLGLIRLGIPMDTIIPKLY